MKQIILGLAIVAASLSACSNNNTQSKEDNTKSNVEATNTEAKKPFSVNEVVTGYLNIKNALAADNGKEAAAAGNTVSAAIQKMEEASLTPEQKKVFDDVKDDIKEHGEHIGNNGDKIAHQREHFDMLSKDMYDLVKAFKPDQKLYQDHCPMYNDGKGANWLSEVKEMKNPYLGKKMPTCGTVKEEIKQ